VGPDIVTGVEEVHAMTERKFEARLHRPEGTGTWTYFDIPFNVLAVFGSKGQVRVRGSLNGHAFRGLAMPHGDGTHYVVVNKASRDAIGVSAGGRVKVRLTADLAPRRVEIPLALQRAFRGDKAAKQVFERLPYSHQKEYVDWILAAKKEETRAGRVEKALSMLTSGGRPKARGA
jgi:hypothetical protein